MKTYKHKATWYIAEWKSDVWCYNYKTNDRMNHFIDRKVIEQWDDRKPQEEKDWMDEAWHDFVDWNSQALKDYVKADFIQAIETTMPKITDKEISMCWCSHNQLEFNNVAKLLRSRWIKSK